MSVFRALIVLVVVAVAGASVGCAHQVVVDASVPGATISVDGEELGQGPQTIERTVFIGDQLRVSARKEGYEPATISVAASEWYPYPLALAMVPLLGVPLSLPALIIPFAGPFIAVGVAVVWAVATSPTLLAIGLTRKYPDAITIPLKRVGASTPYLLPEDLFGVPQDNSPNPIPHLGATGGTPTKPPDKPPQTSPGANPVP